MSIFVLMEITVGVVMLINASLPVFMTAPRLYYNVKPSPTPFTPCVSANKETGIIINTVFSPHFYPGSDTTHC